MSSANRLLLALGFAALTATLPGFCQTLSVPAYVAVPGACGPLAVLFANAGAPISALQFDLSFDDSSLNLSPVIGSAARNSGKSLYLGAPASNRTRFAIWELNQNQIPSGAVVNLFVNIAPDAAPGVYPIHFESVAAADSNSRPIPVSTSDGILTLKSFPGSPVVAQAILNGATLLPGPVAPGEVITIIGSAIGSSSSPDTLTFDGLAAPVIGRSANQLNAVVPFGATGHLTTTLHIVSSSGTSTTISLRVAPSTPGIFTVNGGGAGQGAILNQDLSVNSHDNPADRGALITMYATGVGQTDPPGTDGLVSSTVLPKPLLPVAVQIGGGDAQIVYAGAAPGMISGILQVNCRVPMQITPGDAVPVILSAGTATSPSVTVAVK
jgi:uncharacterized protein (TIGR03437 family)